MQGSEDSGAFLYISYQVIVILGVLLTVLLRPSRRSWHGFVLTGCEWMLAVNVGLAGLMGAWGHVFMANEIAASIGWQPSPFQFEVAMANLGFGVAGVLAIWFRGGFWWGAWVPWAVFLWGAAGGHINQIVSQGNFAPNNAGVILYWDILAPLVLLVFLVLHTRNLRARREAAIST